MLATTRTRPAAPTFYTLFARNFLLLQQQTKIRPSLVSMETRDFSLKMRKVNEKKARVKKFKLKTKKAFQKRFRICGSLRNKMFKFQAQGYRHLNRNKTGTNLNRTRGRFL